MIWNHYYSLLAAVGGFIVLSVVWSDIKWESLIPLLGILIGNHVAVVKLERQQNGGTRMIKCPTCDEGNVILDASPGSKYKYYDLDDPGRENKPKAMQYRCNKKKCEVTVYWWPEPPPVGGPLRPGRPYDF